MIEMIDLCRVELFKIRKRVLPWVLLVVAGGVFTLFLWLNLYRFVKTMVQVRRTMGDLSAIKVEFLHNFNIMYGQGGGLLSRALYWPNNLYRTFVDAVAIFFAAGAFNQDASTGMSRILMGHGLRRSRYLAAQGAALLASLVFAWSTIALVVLLLASAYTYFLEGEFVWQSSYWVDVLRMIAGNSLRYFSVGCFVHLTIVLSRKPLLGVLGGVFYFLQIEPIVPWLLGKHNLPQLIPYTPLHASNALLDPSVAMTGLDLVRALLVLFLSGALSLALAAVIFNKRDLA